MYLTLIILPLLGSISSGFFGRKIGVSGSHLITSSLVITTTILAILAFFAFFIPFGNILNDNSSSSTSDIKHGTGIKNPFEFFIHSDKNIQYVSSKHWDSNISEISDITSIGNIMYTSYSIWLIIVSIILLLAMVGSIVITIKQKY